MKGRTGIFGGTFDPIHYGHLRSAEEVRVRFELDRVIFVPPYVHPLKPSREGASASDRLEMTRLAVESNPSFEVSDFEVSRREVSYTVITLDYFRQKYPKSELFFILGMDGWLEITTWYKYTKLFELANIVVHSRPGYAHKDPRDTLGVEPASKLVYDGESYRHASGNRLWFVSVTDIEISATEIRKYVSSGAGIRYLVPDNVLEYIEKHGLYRQPA